MAIENNPKKDNDKGTNLAKVLWYYNLLYDTTSLQQKIICPFHEDANPSMLVNLDEGNWHCFGCNESGNAQRFVQLMEKRYNNLDDLRSYKKYRSILKSDKCSDIHIGAAQRLAQPSKKEQYDEAYMYYHGLRTVDWLVDQEDEVQQAKEYMLQRGFSPKTLNLIKAKVTYNWSYGLIFPMMDNGKFKGWVSRTMHKQIEEKRKYLYNAGFSRATTLVGNYGSKDYVFVVEGFMDRLKFVQYGVHNVVAILGWKMSPQQIQKLKDAGVKYLISALDNDTCGRKGTKYLQTLPGFKVIRWKYLKGIKDPGEMDQERFRKMFDKTMAEYSSLKKTKGATKNGRFNRQYQK